MGWYCSKTKLHVLCCGWWCHECLVGIIWCWQNSPSSTCGEFVHADLCMTSSILQCVLWNLNQLLCGNSLDSAVVGLASIVWDYLSVPLLGFCLDVRQAFSDFFDSMLANSLFPWITLPTRLDKNSCTLIDNIYFKLSPLFADATSGIIFSRISDHFPYFIGLKLQVSSNDKKSRFVKVYTNKENGIHALLESLRAANTYELLDDNPYSNPNLIYNKLHSCIMELKEKHLSYKLVKFNKYKHKGNKWITNGIIKSLKFRDKLYKEMRSLNTNSPSYATIKQNLTVYNQLLKKSIREAKTIYYNNEFNQNDDVIMGAKTSQITNLTIVYSTTYSDADQSKHQSSASLAFVWGIHRDRWIPRTKGQ